MREKSNLVREAGFIGALQHRPQDLSGGQKQRVSLAGVLIVESPILLLTSPWPIWIKSGQDTII